MSTTGRAARAAWSAATALIVCTLVTLPASSGPAAAATGYCAPSATPTVVWDGGGTTNSWFEAANWNTDDVPGFNDLPLKRVCLPSSAAVDLPYGDFDGLTTLDSLDMAPGSTLAVRVSGRLLLEGAQGSVSSYVRRADDGTAATLAVEGVLGGKGNVTVDGVLRLKRTASGPPTMTTRYCELTEAGCTPDVATTTPGRTTVGRRGLLRVTGLASAAPNLQGSALSDRRVIDVKGEMRIESPAYLAVDDGTRITVRKNKQAKIVLEGGASIYQGRFAFGDPVAVLDLRGTIAKSAKGTGLLDLDVQVASTARSEVLGGRLSIGGNRAPKAKVSDGASYGTGRCAGAQSNCASPTASSTDPLTVEVGLPKERGKQRATVAVTEKPAAQTGQDVVPPVDIHVTDAVATKAKPMTYRFVVDSQALGARTAASLVVSRNGQKVANCKPDGTPKTGQACVSKRTTLSGGDVELTIRSQVSSRWKIR